MSNKNLIALRIAWNVALIVVGAYVARLLFPKIMMVFSGSAMTDDAAFRVRYYWTAAQGVGLIALAWFVLASLSTPTWRPLRKKWRVLFGACAALFVLGAAADIAITYWGIGAVVLGDPLTFAATALIAAFPIVCFGTGYVGLLLRAARRSFGNSAQHNP